MQANQCSQSVSRQRVQFSEPVRQFVAFVHQRRQRDESEATGGVSSRICLHPPEHGNGEHQHIEQSVDAAFRKMIQCAGRIDRGRQLATHAQAIHDAIWAYSLVSSYRQAIHEAEEWDETRIQQIARAFAALNASDLPAFADIALGSSEDDDGDDDASPRMLYQVSDGGGRILAASPGLASLDLPVFPAAASSSIRLGNPKWHAYVLTDAARGRIGSVGHRDRTERCPCTRHGHGGPRAVAPRAALPDASMIAPPGGTRVWLAAGVTDNGSGVRSTAAIRLRRRLRTLSPALLYRRQMRLWLPSRWLRRPRFDGMAAGERSLAGHLRSVRHVGMGCLSSRKFTPVSLLFAKKTTLCGVRHRSHPCGSTRTGQHQTHYSAARVLSAEAERLPAVRVRAPLYRMNS